MACGDAPLDPRIMEYLYGVFSNKSMFETWDLMGIVRGMKEIVQTTDHTCICIAAAMNGARRHVKVAQHANPADMVVGLNAAKPRRSHGGRRARTAPDDWRILAYLVVDRREVDCDAIASILHTCKARRQLSDRILVLIDVAVERRQTARIVADVITRESEWYMHTVTQRLGGIPQFVQRLKAHCECVAE